MHKNGFFHRDLKPENLLMYNSIVKICDFGLAREIRSRPPFTEYVSTRWYRAPQLLLKSTSYNSPVDVFAFGCIMAELYNLSPLFPGNNQTDQLHKIIKILGTPDRSDWPEGYKLAQAIGMSFPEEQGVNLADVIPQACPQAIDLLESMLRYSSRKRITMTEILKHQYFKGIILPVDKNLTEISEKQIVFQEKPVGKILDTTKEDKNIDKFRATKQKFRQTRRHDALQSNPFKFIQKHNHKQQVEDIDTIIAELQAKKKKKSQAISMKEIKTPLLYTSKPQKQRQRFHTQFQEERKQSSQPLKTEERQEKRYKINTDKNIQYEHKKFISNKYDYLNKKQIKSENKNLFAYQFQPVSLPFLLPSYSQKAHVGFSAPNRGTIHYSHLASKQKQGLEKGLRCKNLSPLIPSFRY